MLNTIKNHPNSFALLVLFEIQTAFLQKGMNTVSKLWVNSMVDRILYGNQTRRRKTLDSNLVNSA